VTLSVSMLLVHTCIDTQKNIHAATLTHRYTDIKTHTHTHMYTLRLYTPRLARLAYETIRAWQLELPRNTHAITQCVCCCNENTHITEWYSAMFSRDYPATCRNIIHTHTHTTHTYMWMQTHTCTDTQTYTQ